MLEFERLKRRSQDHLLIETIKRVGASNYSLIARLTGMNPETVRYKIGKQFVKFGLGVSLNINYSELGFSLGLLKVTPGRASGKSWLDHAHYLMLVSKVESLETYVCLYGIPFRFKKKYAGMFDELKRRNLIESFEFSELRWVRYPPFRSEFYDFDQRCWSFDWRRIDATAQEAGATSTEVNRDPAVDDIDLKILKRLKEVPTIGLAKVGKEIGVNPRTVRYHNAEHIMKGNLILGNNIRWIWPFQHGRINEIMQVLATFKGLTTEQMATARKLFNKLPFTWLEGGTESMDYIAFMDIPILSFHETLKYIEAHTESIRGKAEISLLDPSKTEYLNIPDDMFDKRLGWRLFGLPGEAEPVQAAGGGRAEPRA